jgi:STE24 endopeptidase
MAGSMETLLVVYLVLRSAQLVAETALARLNHRHALEPSRIAAAGRALGIDDAELQQAAAYSRDRHRFGLVSSWVEVSSTLGVVATGGLGLFERAAVAASSSVGGGSIAVGLVFLALLAVAGSLLSLPFELYSTFVIEARHGFNRQTWRGFLLDRLKGAALAVALGGPLAAALLWVMERMGSGWWLWAWALVVGFNLLAAWIYPTVLAPIFNRFTPLPEGELRDGILDLARRTGFRAGGVYVMDASRRTAHGNAYFTGLFGQKRIVLFDTLIDALGAREVIAVLAHELGHFRLHHVRWAIARSVASSGVLFFLLSLALPATAFYTAFALRPSSYGALVVFGAWFSLAGFLLQPLENALSRRHEFAADAFAIRNGATPAELGAALRRLREKSRLLPVVHPLYSRVYHSHPPLVERLRAIGAL